MDSGGNVSWVAELVRAVVRPGVTERLGPHRPHKT